jgi:NitT/TauT family transport system substrate-binding protein
MIFRKFIKKFCFTYLPTLFLLMIIVIFISGCNKSNEKSIILADQFGLAYAPIEIMKHEKLIEKNYEGTLEVQWVKMANTQTIREAMLSKNLDVGFMAIPPFLIGVDTGMSWKIISGISESPLGLLAKKEFRSLEDLVGNGKIALPQPGSIQHILLSMAAQKTLKDSQVFDRQLISMKHPDGLNALLSSQDVIAHFTAPPYLQKGIAEEAVYELLTGEEAFEGEFTFIVGVCQDTFFEDKAIYRAVMDALEEAFYFIEHNRQKTIEILSTAYTMDKVAVEEQLYNQGMHFGGNLKGADKFYSFMRSSNMLVNDIDLKSVVVEVGD